jgi:hypothetical protein
LECAKKNNTVTVKKEALVDLLHDAAINNKFQIKRMLDCALMQSANSNITSKITITKVLPVASPFSRNVIKPKCHTNVKVGILIRPISKSAI